MYFWSFTFTANNYRKQLVTSDHFCFVSLRKEHREMVFSYPQNQRQLAAMRLKVLRQNCVRPVDTMPQRHTGAGSCPGLYSAQRKKKKTGRQNSEEMEQRYNLDKQNLKTQKTRNKVRKEELGGETARHR